VPDHPAGGDAAADLLVRQLRDAVSGQLQRNRGDTTTTSSTAAPGAGASTGDPHARRQLVQTLLDQALLSHAQAAIASGGQPMDPATKDSMRHRVLDALLAMGPLQPLLDDADIENIDINGADIVWVHYTDGRRAQLPPLFPDDAALVAWVRDMAAHSGGQERRFDAGAPAVSVQLRDGSRMFAVMSVVTRPSVSIRKFPVLRPTLDQLVEDRELSPAMGALFTALVRARRNIIVAGGTYTGKTTFLRALASAIPPYERLVTVEDTLELGLDQDPQHPNTVALCARPANIEGLGAVELSELVRWALRMRPDRVVVGECRGPETVPMCNAMSQGNDGSMTTVHASSAAQAFSKLATYAAQGPQPLGFEATAMLLGAAVHFVVHLGWSPDGRRVVSSVREVTGCDGQRVTSNEVYRPGPDRRGRHTVPLRHPTVAALTEVGFDPAVLDADRDGWS
jgi:Flp pilus assembly CpaF family ATPase